jgi:hypothetical protein
MTCGPTAILSVRGRWRLPPCREVGRACTSPNQSFTASITAECLHGRQGAGPRKRTCEPHFPPAYLAVWLLKPLCGDKNVWRSPVTINGERSVGIAEAYHGGRLLRSHLRSDFVAKSGLAAIPFFLVNDGHFARQQTPCRALPSISIRSCS